ncbi:MAG: hypothetical protein GY784_17465 [Gammaproteobacteria bacterium]|nr:hypothetical protein [Gammaproteobacteria bacterium]
MSLTLAALLFLSQSLAFAYQGKASFAVEGYTQTICTMYGLDTVFVPFGSPHKDSVADCLECTICLIQANLKGLAIGFSPNTDALYILDGSITGPASYALSSPYLFLLFQSRAPPA